MLTQDSMKVAQTQSRVIFAGSWLDFKGAWGSVVFKALRDRSPVTGNFFRGIRQFHVPTQPLKMSTSLRPLAC